MRRRKSERQTATANPFCKAIIMHILEELERIAREAGAIAQGARAEGLAVTAKAQGEIVTSADRAVHTGLMAAFARHFPGLPLLTEESPRHAIPAGPFLVADEIDGTAPFSAGSAQWGVMLAWMDPAPTHAVIHLPDLGVTITAAQGEGCWLNGGRVALRADDALGATLLGAEFNKRLRPEEWAWLQRLVSAARAVRATACSAASTHELLSGVTGLYVNPRGGRIWDFAAPALAISEAGGQICAPDGRPLAWDGVEMGLVAGANRGLLDTALALRKGVPTVGPEAARDPARGR